jgi:AcrR family transcriptional regulator
MKQTKNPMKWRELDENNPLQIHQPLYDATLDEFSSKAFHEASLNDIIKKVNMNKGSFYYRFHDKMDLYLSMIERIGMEKIRYFTENSLFTEFPTDFFDQMHLLARSSIQFAKAEMRIFNFWKRFRNEDSQIRQMVKATFKEMSDSTLDSFVIAALKKGQFSNRFPEDFIILLVRFIISNLDSFIEPDLDDDGVVRLVDALVLFLRHGLQA